MKVLAIAVLAVMVAGCSAVGSNTLNTMFDRIQCQFATDTPEHAKELKSTIAMLDPELHRTIIAKYEMFLNPITSAPELCKKNQELLEFLHTWYKASGQYLYTF